jgi:hypothetical protein
MFLKVTTAFYILGLGLSIVKQILGKLEWIVFRKASKVINIIRFELMLPIFITKVREAISNS